MNITEIFKDSLIYPTKDWDKLIMLGALMIIIGVVAIIAGFAMLMLISNFIATIIIAVIAAIVILIIGLIFNGYSLSIIKETIENNQMSETVEKFPDFDWINNIVDGIKVTILSIVYMIIPIIITAIVAFALGLFSNFTLFNPNIANFSTLSSNPANIQYLNEFNPAFSIVQGLFSILTLIASLFIIIAKARLAETSKFSSIFEFREIYGTIAKIGLGNYIVWYILLMIISSLLGFLLGVIALIPIIGVIICFLLLVPYLLIFESRATGLIYNESKNENQNK